MCEKKTPAAAVAAAAGMVAATVAGAVVVISAAGLLLVVVAAAADVALAAMLAAVLRDGGQMWRPAAQVKAPARVAVEGRTAPLAIEARHVIPGVVISDDARKEAAT